MSVYEKMKLKAFHFRPQALGWFVFVRQCECVGGGEISIVSQRMAVVFAIIVASRMQCLALKSYGLALPV